MRTFGITWALFVGMAAVVSSASARDDAAAEALEWELGAQCWTFREFTFLETVAKAESLGLRYLEIFPGQAFGDGAGKVGHDMPVALRDRMVVEAAAAGITIGAYGVVNADSAEGWRAIFDFARALNLRSISTEPKPEWLDTVEALCEETGIRAAIHNHPEPSRYWHPETVLKAIEGRSALMGACADTGHWTRSGLDPVECLRMLEGRIISLHFKDLNRNARRAHDVPWGTGVSNAPGVLRELRRQGFAGHLSIEYEHNWLHSLPAIADSVAWFDRALNVIREE